jgi:hypothetical protein
MPSRDRCRRRPLRPARPARSTRERSAGLLPGLPQTGRTRSGTAVVGWIRAARRPRPVAPVLTLRLPYARQSTPRPRSPSYGPRAERPAAPRPRLSPQPRPLAQGHPHPEPYGHPVTTTAPAGQSDPSPSSRTRGCPAAELPCPVSPYRLTPTQPAVGHRPACSVSPRPGPGSAVRRRPARPSRRPRTSAAAAGLLRGRHRAAAILSFPPPTSPRPRPAWNR